MKKILKLSAKLSIAILIIGISCNTKKSKVCDYDNYLNQVGIIDSLKSRLYQAEMYIKLSQDTTTFKDYKSFVLNSKKNLYDDGVFKTKNSKHYYHTIIDDKPLLISIDLQELKELSNNSITGSIKDENIIISDWNNFKISINDENKGKMLFKNSSLKKEAIITQEKPYNLSLINVTDNNLNFEYYSTKKGEYKFEFIITNKRGEIHFWRKIVTNI